MSWPIEWPYEWPENSNAERDAALKDLAQVQRRMLRALKSLA